MDCCVSIHVHESVLAQKLQHSKHLLFHLYDINCINNIICIYLADITRYILIQHTAILSKQNLL